jgi:nucleotide-binding universal stress UspA family protein
MLKKLLVPLDGSSLAEVAISRAVRLVAASGALDTGKLVLFRVVEDEANLSAAQAYLEEHAARIRESPQGSNQHPHVLALAHTTQGTSVPGAIFGTRNTRKWTQSSLPRTAGPALTGGRSVA